MKVQFKDICGNTIFLQLPIDATISIACRCLSKKLEILENQIFIVSPNDKSNFYSNNELIKDVIKENPEYLVFGIFNKTKQNGIDDIISDSKLISPQIKYEFFFKSLQNTNILHNPLYEDYKNCLKKIPNDLQEKIESIAALGFGKEDIKEALRSSEFNIIFAVNLLMKRYSNEPIQTSHNFNSQKKANTDIQDNMHNTASKLTPLKSYINLNEVDNTSNNDKDDKEKKKIAFNFTNNNDKDDQEKKKKLFVFSNNNKNNSNNNDTEFSFGRDTHDATLNKDYNISNNNVGTNLKSKNSEQKKQVLSGEIPWKSKSVGSTSNNEIDQKNRAWPANSINNERTTCSTEDKKIPSWNNTDCNIFCQEKTENLTFYEWNSNKKSDNWNCSSWNDSNKKSNSWNCFGWNDSNKKSNSWNCSGWNDSNKKSNSWNCFGWNDSNKKFDS